MEPNYLLLIAYLVAIPGTTQYALPMVLPQYQTEKVASHAGPAQRPVGGSDILGSQAD